MDGVKENKMKIIIITLLLTVGVASAITIEDANDVLTYYDAAMSWLTHPVFMDNLSDTSTFFKQSKDDLPLFVNDWIRLNTENQTLQAEINRLIEQISEMLSYIPADFTKDGKVDKEDFTVFAKSWLLVEDPNTLK